MTDTMAVGSLYVDGDGELWRVGATVGEDVYVAPSEYQYENGQPCPLENGVYHLRNDGICEGCGSNHDPVRQGGQAMSHDEYVAPPDGEEELTVWYAAAYGTHHRSNDQSFWDWDDGTDGILTFTDTGDRGAGPRAQLVIYLDPRGGGSRRAVGASLEIDAADARRIAERLLRWADSVIDPFDSTPEANVMNHDQDCPNYEDHTFVKHHVEDNNPENGGNCWTEEICRCST